MGQSNDQCDHFAAGLEAFLADDKISAVTSFVCAAEAGSSEALGYLALCYADLGLPAEAERAFRSAIDAGDEGAVVGYGNFLADVLGRPQEAMALYQEARAKGSTVAARNLALLMTDLGRYDEAITILCNLKNHEPESMVALGYAYESAGRLTDAAVAYQHAANAGDIQAWRRLGYVMLDMGRKASAENAFQTGLEAGDAEAIGALCEFMVAEGRTRDAEILLRDHVLAGSSSAKLYYGNILGDQPGREKEAIAVYRSAIMDGDVRASTNLADLLIRMGRSGEAESLLLDAARQGDQLGRQRLLDLYIHAGRIADAEALVIDQTADPVDGALDDLLISLEEACLHEDAERVRAKYRPRGEG